LAAVVATACSDGPTEPDRSAQTGLQGEALDRTLDSILTLRGVTGRLEERLETRLGRTVDPALADLGRLLFFDPILSLAGDNSCAGCHGPNVSLNGARPIAIGVGNNGVVGPGRSGPHNLRRAPTLINAAFYPKLMWEGRFEALSLDPFDNRSGFAFPEPEGLGLSGMDHLLGAQAFTPVVSRMEMAGFDFVGSNDDMRSVIAARVDGIPDYRRLFAVVDPEIEDGRPIVYADVAAALAEFTLTLVRADAPIDEYARGDHDALTAGQKRGGVLFFGKAQCGECHITRGYASEMFSDFENHVLGVPQIVPVTSNANFDGPGADEDFGLERVTGDERHRYRFRTTPLRNVGYQPSFMHNGAYRCLEDAVRHHLDVYRMLEDYDTQTPDMSVRGWLAPMGPVLRRLHDLSSQPPPISPDEFDDIVAFLRFALSDPDAHPERLRSLVPGSVPSGLPVHDFQFGAPLPACE
jgi:cytochrome c peroxidase